MPIYTNAYKGRANRQESASHLKDEFDRIEAAFATLALQNISYSTVYDHIHTEGNTLIDPSNGLMQEITLTRDTLIEIKDPTTGVGATGSRLTLIVHGANWKVINGWGPQTWKENGNNDWLWLYTCAGDRASAVFEYAYDGKAWTCLSFTRNDAFGFVFPDDQALFPFISDTTDTTGGETLVWSRSSYAGGLDDDATWVILPPNQARFTGNRYAKSWISTASDLQAEGWVEDGATVTTEGGGGPTGNDVDKVTFDITNGELAHWMLLHFGRSAESSEPIKFVVSFDAKMAGVISSGSCRAVIAVMGVDSGSTVQWDRQTFNLTDQWRSYGAVLDPITAKNPKSLDLTAAAGARTLIKFALESPSDGLGNPILVENVTVVVLKEGDTEAPTTPIETSIGASMVLAETAGSTGTWVDGTKLMTLTNGQFVDFQDSLTIGRAYLVSIERVSGNTCDVRLDDDRVFWQGNSLSNADTTFVKDGPFTIHYEGGVVKFFQSVGDSSYLVNIYEISDEIGIYGDINANTINNGVITYLEGGPIPSNIAVGVAYTPDTVVNLLGIDEHRTFSNWITDGNNPMNVNRGEYGVNARPSHGTLLEDNSTSAVRYIAKVIPIPADTKTYIFSIFIRLLYDGTTQIVYPDSDGIVTSASKYVDIAFTLLGGTAQLGAGIRVNMREGTVSSPANTYSHLGAIHYQKWVHLQVGHTNNGTNDEAVLQVFAAGGTSPTSQILATTKGWCIIDWAQLTDTGDPGDITIPGDPRTPESVSSLLDDGLLYNSVPEEVGNITGGVFTFNESEIYKNITWIKS